MEAQHAIDGWGTLSPAPRCHNIRAFPCVWRSGELLRILDLERPSKLALKAGKTKSGFRRECRQTREEGKHIRSTTCRPIPIVLIVTLFGKTGLNENSVVMHFQCILNALIMHYNALIMVLNAFVMLFSPL